MEVSGKELVITRVSDAFPGESGVHTCKPCRGVDARGEYDTNQGIMHRYEPEEVKQIVFEINEKYKRDDGKDCCIYHNFGEGPKHFHFQIPFAWLEPEELGIKAAATK
jgi:hypothetical protein